MEYTVRQLADLAGVSSRTLRYYDQIGLLSPGRDTGSGYRRYGPPQVARLQQILFYRELGLELAQVASILDDPTFDPAAALEEHLRQLRARRGRLDGLIDTAQKTLNTLKGERTMNDTERFEAFKKKMIDDNEEKYGAEVRANYGDAEADAANAKMMKMTPDEYARFTALGEELNETLKRAVLDGDPTGPLGQQAAALHKRWLCFTWPQYNAEAHKNLTQMYVDDARFTAYYEAIAPGAAVFIRDAVAVMVDGGEA